MLLIGVLPCDGDCVGDPASRRDRVDAVELAEPRDDRTDRSASLAERPRHLSRRMNHMIGGIGDIHADHVERRISTV